MEVGVVDPALPGDEVPPADLAVVKDSGFTSFLDFCIRDFFVREIFVVPKIFSVFLRRQMELILCFLESP